MTLSFRFNRIDNRVAFFEKWKIIHLMQSYFLCIHGSRGFFWSGHMQIWLPSLQCSTEGVAESYEPCSCRWKLCCVGFGRLFDIKIHYRVLQSMGTYLLVLSENGPDQVNGLKCNWPPYTFRASCLCQLYWPFLRSQKGSQRSRVSVNPQPQSVSEICRHCWLTLKYLNCICILQSLKKRKEYRFW